MKDKIIYGCMGIGNWNQNPISDKEIKKGFIAIEAALENGIRDFDHANIYTFGKAESIFGMFLKQNPEVRDKIKINSKAGIILNSGINGSNTYGPHGEYLLKEVEESLRRLQIDYLDSFIIHRYDPLVSARELAQTLDSIVETGLVKNIGISNIPPKMVAKIASFCEHKPISCQIQFSLGHSDLIKHNTFFNLRKGDIYFDTLEDYETLGLEIQAWGPLDKGLYLNSFSSNPYVINTRKLVNEIAAKYEVPKEAILTAWIKKLPYNLIPIIGTTTPERIKNSTQNIELSREDWYNLWISALHEPLP